MTGNDRRPDLAGIGAADDAFDGKLSLDAEHAHLFGRGVSATATRSQARRGLEALRDAWPDVVASLIRREVQQAFLEALPAFWCRRAETFEAVGTPSADDAAKACRRHAWLLASGGLPEHLAAELDDYLEVVR